LTCSENQDVFFTKVYEKEVRVGDNVFNATWVDANISADASCRIYLTCEKSPLMQSMEATKNIIGYWKFFAEANLSQKDDDEPENLSCGLIRPVCVHFCHD
jgi:hypothetical protein